MLAKSLSSHNQKAREKGINQFGMWTLSIVAITAIVLGIFYGCTHCSITEKQEVIIEKFVQIAKENPEEIESIEITLNGYPKTFIIENGEFQKTDNAVISAIVNSIYCSLCFLVTFVFAWFIIFMTIKSILLYSKEKS